MRFNFWLALKRAGSGLNLHRSLPIELFYHINHRRQLRISAALPRKTRSKLNSLWTGRVQKASYDKVQAHAQECNHFTVNKQALVIPHEVAGLCPNPADKPSSVSNLMVFVIMI